MTQAAPSPAASGPLLSARGVTKHFPITRGLLSRTVGHVRAVDGIDLDVSARECVGVVGESGSGKSTLGRALLRLIEPTAGTVDFDGVELGGLSPAELRAFRRHMQMIFQDPFASLNPRMKIGAAMREAMKLHKICPVSEIDDRIAAMLERVGMSADHASRFPKAFSGGQRQRIAIARALAVGPKFLVADEPVSALDVSIQAEVIELLLELRREFSLATVFISHDLSVVEVVAERVMVMYLGKVMEVGDTRRIFSAPSHPYTRALLSAIPSRHERPGRVVLKGEIPSPSKPPSGCVFRTRCPYALPDCATTVPELRPAGEGQFKACIRDDIAKELAA